MLPLQQAIEIKASITEYLKATFGFKDKSVYDSFFNFIDDKETGIFKGPYISLKLPFVTADKDAVIPLEIKPNFPPYKHQQISFERLTTENNKPKPTILTTGTGSGKTECFMYPVLDYCYKHLGKKGIKTIILYPMNALATDQAQRLAEAIYDDERLKGKVTAGLFIGVGQDKKDFSTVMGQKNIIENRETILSSPPDILLTNFKMLDYALMRSNYFSLWKSNIDKGEQLLQFLVLDELHTYDGAKATDVANLIRRLKLKLGIEKGNLCPVGTSATIGNHEDSKNDLTEYAAKIFEEDFTLDAIIGETRKTAAEFFPEEEAKKFIPTEYQINKFILSGDDDYASYINNQKELWGLDPSISQDLLGEELKKYQIVRDIIAITAKEIVSLTVLTRELGKLNPEYRNLHDKDHSNSIFNLKNVVLNSILALISEAKMKSGSKFFPFLYLQVQIWIRELSGLFRQFEESPAFIWREDLAYAKDRNAFPIYFCRECGASGFLIEKHDSKEKLTKEPNSIYDKFFSNNKDLYFANINEDKNLCIDEYSPTDTINLHIDKESLEEVTDSGDNTINIIGYRRVNKDQKNEHVCPYCNTLNNLSVLGTRVATLSSITAGQILSSNLDLHTEKDRKVLIFSNGVQDAAHHAGFIQSRNYRFSFRTAMQQVINRCLLQNKDLTLAGLKDEFVNYWKKEADPSGNNPLLAYYNKFFPSDYQGKIDIDANGKDKKFEIEFDNRVSWEIFAEFGYNSIIGRTLEKTGSAIAYIEPLLLKTIYEEMQPWLVKQTLGHINEKEFLHFCLGFLHRLRTRGGINHKYLGKFRTENTNYYLINKKSNPAYFLIRNFGKKTRLPKFITNSSNSSDIFDRYKTKTKKNWYTKYYAKSFSLGRIDIAEDFYDKLIELMLHHQILDQQKNDKGINNYAIVPDILKVSNEVVVLVCKECNHKIAVAKGSLESTIGSKCLSYTCKAGVYEESDKEDSKYTYYKNVYNRKNSPRIYACEHTGILARRERESREDSFKNRPNFNSYNVLVATATLEMGIDIGDLTSTVNSSIPPLTSNFLQRVGRAGRSIGSALIVNFAIKKDHDLYYYKDPLLMMNGEVNTPGCYLEAKEILKRHFLAYCIDCWTAENPDKNFIPNIIRNLNLETGNLDLNSFFINRLIDFIKSKNRSGKGFDYSNKLLISFSLHYEKSLFTALKEIDNDLLNNSLYLKLKLEFEKIKTELKNLAKQRDEIKNRLKVQKLSDNDQEKKDLDDEIKNINGTKKNILNRMILEQMTNSGLLPNYAFPETGVTLNAVVRNNDHDKEIEITRAASSAIRELVPGNYFYTQGFKLNISGLTINDWNKEVLIYRFCSNCDHLEIDSGQKGNCPKCGDESWKDINNKKRCLKLNNVKSFNDQKSSVIDDSRDERERSFTAVSQHFKFKGDIKGSIAIVNSNFGLEYDRSVEIVDLNLAARNSNSLPFTINNREVSETGYIVCKTCGKTHILSNSNDKLDFHYPYCQHRDIGYGDKDSEGKFESLYLLRSMQTEAIKILLPVQDYEFNTLMAIFKAGIIIGIKKYFKGNADHLKIAPYTEYNKRTAKNDRYLVIYDTIPGGTGYLEKVYSKTVFSKVIAEAYKVISNCTCEDGCYSCIYSYDNQFDRGVLSRQLAEKLFSELNDSKDQWEDFSESINNVTNNGRLEESELELNFIRILKEYFKENNYLFTEQTVDGNIFYNLTISKNDTEIRYCCKPQISLSQSNGVARYTRPDFIFYCTDVLINKRSDISLAQKIKPIAVYLDGFQYHASEENFRFVDDVDKRLAILDSNRYWCFTFSWNDLEEFKNHSEDEISLKRKGVDFLKKIDPDKHPILKHADMDFQKIRNSFSRFIYFLQSANDENILKQAAILLYGFQTKFTKYMLNETDAVNFVLNRDLEITDLPKFKNKSAYLYLDKVDTFKDINIRFMINLDSLDPKLKLYYQVSTIDKKEWQNFWNLFNLLQFCHINPFSISVPITVTALDNDEVLENFDEQYHSLVKLLLDKGIEFNTDDYFVLTDDNDAIIAEAELGIESKKIVSGVLEGYEKIFIEKGFTIMEAEAIILMIND